MPEPHGAESHVSMRGVKKVFPAREGTPAVHALGPVDLDLRKGEFFAVVGPSGCGKSTLLELIAGLARASEGSIQFEGKPIGGAVASGVGVVFQEDACFPWSTVAANVAFGLRKSTLSAADKERRVADVLALM
ncbi:MAG TPA: ATP-binding cassette domain-containing protein, partial [Casimicrobiaceae bacterium]|nr:ATP-binding cassette domain-containing protein [Casimicrobiaceae bacterium]